MLIFLSLVLALIGWSPVFAQDGFYVIPGMKGKYAPVPKTGQTTSSLPKDDGDLEKGVAWPTPRFTDNGNGTVTDKLTGLIWTINANYFGQRTWAQALDDAYGLQSGTAGLTDGSKAGDWRLPSRKELESLVDCGRFGPALPADHLFTGTQSSYYWSSTTNAGSTSNAWDMNFADGSVGYSGKVNILYVWCVRGGP
jgi:hypothetical protein